MKKQIQIIMLFFVVLIQAQQNRSMLAPINDEGVGAIEIQNGNVISNYPVVGTNISATVSNVPVSGCDELRKDTWFSVLIPASGTLTIETSQADSNSIYDTVMSVYSGSLSSLVLVDCNDDLDGLSGFSRVVLSGRPVGEKLYISVWRFGDSGIGDFKVSAFDSSILSTATNTEVRVAVFPNPTSSILNFSHLDKEFKVEIYNLLGQRTLNTFVNQSQPTIDVSGFESGTYVLKMSNDETNSALKFTKL